MRTCLYGFAACIVLIPQLSVSGVVSSTISSVDTSPWLGRSIYFIVTDRYARSDPKGEEPCAGKGWCGGTIAGVEQKLDYIQNMGFDAIWITPVVEQVPWLDHWNGTGYHGYWARDFNKIEPRLGTEADLKSLQVCKPAATVSPIIILD